MVFIASCSQACQYSAVDAKFQTVFSDDKKYCVDIPLESQFIMEAK